MKQKLKRIIKSSLFILTFLNVIISCLLYFVDRPFWFNENQILYIFATIAQVTGGLFGLTFAAYTLIDEKFKKIGDKEETSVDTVKKIRAENFDKLKYISALSIFSIVFSILVISIFRNNYLCITIFFMLETTTLFVFLLGKIYAFINSASPATIEKEKASEKKDIEASYKEESNVEEKSLGTFITYYNLLENSIKDLAQNLVLKTNQTVPLQLLDALDILEDQNIISPKCYGQINDLRLYRNSLVHSTDSDKNVNGTLYQILETIYLLFSKISSTYSNNQTLDTALITELKQYVDSLPINIDIELFNFLVIHPSATLYDIAGNFNISAHFTHKKLEKMVSYGLLEKQKEKRYTKWRLAQNYINNHFSFNYSNNNGKYVIGHGICTFTTKWSKASDKLIHAYSDPSNIECIALIKNCYDLTSITIHELSSYDYSSRYRDAAIGDVIIWKNTSGHYLLTLIKSIQDDTRGTDSDLLECDYRIITDTKE